MEVGGRTVVDGVVERKIHQIVRHREELPERWWQCGTVCLEGLTQMSIAISITLRGSEREIRDQCATRVLAL